MLKARCAKRALWRYLIGNSFENANRQRRERSRNGRLRIDNRDTGARVREHERPDRRCRDRHMNARAARRRFTPKLLGNRPWTAEETLEAADVDDDGIVAVALVTRRELLRDRNEPHIFVSRMGPHPHALPCRGLERRVSASGGYRASVNVRRLKNAR